MGKFLLAVIFLFLVWDVAWWVLGVKPLFPWQLHKRLRAADPPPVLLDVRTPLEYNWFHLPGAQNLPELLVDGSIMPPLAPTQELVVICMTGHRSPFVSHALKKRGFLRVCNLTGGMVGWKIYEWVSGRRGRLERPDRKKS